MVPCHYYKKHQNLVAPPVQNVPELLEANGIGGKVAALVALAPAAAVLERVSSEDRSAEDDDAALEKAVREQLSRKEKDKRNQRRDKGKSDRPVRADVRANNNSPQPPPRRDNRPPRIDDRTPGQGRPPRRDDRPPLPARPPGPVSLTHRNLPPNKGG